MLERFPLTVRIARNLIGSGQIEPVTGLVGIQMGGRLIVVERGLRVGGNKSEVARLGKSVRKAKWLAANSLAASSK